MQEFTNNQTSFWQRVSEKKYIVLSFGILVVLVSHFVLQMSFIKSENLAAVAETRKIEIPAPANLLDVPKPEARNVEVLTSPKVVPAKTVVRQEQKNHVVETEVPRPTIKRKVVKESKAERLRRAERLLTGI